MKKTSIQKLSLSAMLLAVAFVLPFLTGQIPQIGAKLCPMHLPVLLCGYLCSGPWGLATGFIAPLLRCFIVGMPAPLFPKAIAMAFELATYGFVSGTLHRLLPKKRVYLYLSLVTAMLSGRLVWGFVQLCCVGLDVTRFTLSAFWAGAVVNALPGIIVQLILIPVLVSAVERYKRKNS
ncbi:MAG: ECF transporter S component [Clostridia bacterium]|nr:ECF transporter S component [Clostridia bacterium]